MCLRRRFHGIRRLAAEPSRHADNFGNESASNHQ